MNKTQDLELLTQVDVAAEVKRQLIEQDAQRWRNTQWQAESRRRVCKRISDTEGEAEQIKLLEKCESALMELDEQTKELT